MQDPTSRNIGSPRKTRLLGAGFMCLFVAFTAAAAARGATDAADQPSAGRSNTTRSNAALLYIDAQAAFKRSDYEAAADLYQAADHAGFKDPIIFFNLGVTHYKLADYDAAEAAFANASTYPKIAPLAIYNLGLVARKAGEPGEARGWFQQAARQRGASAKIRRLAEQALQRSPRERLVKPAPLDVAKPELRDFLTFSLNTGYATDSNIYRTPATAYVDLAQTTAPLVNPQVQSGTFIPVDAHAEFRWGTHADGHFSLRYDFDGSFYTDSSYDNANVSRQELSLTGKSVRKTANGYKYFSSKFAVTRTDERYYDRDDGSDQFAGPEDVSARLGRTRYGPRVYYHRKRGAFGYGLRADAFISEYDETLDYLDLTHEQYLAGVHVSYDPLRNTQLRLTYDHSERQYDQRKAKTSGGIRFTTNDELNYLYDSIGLSVRQKLGSALSLYLDYQFTERRDEFEAYDDYERHTGRLRLRYRNRRFSAAAAVTHRIYNYPNSFTFDLPSEGAKELESTYATVELGYRVSDRYAISLFAQQDLVSASDPRSEYAKTTLALSLRWQL